MKQSLDHNKERLRRFKGFKVSSSLDESILKSLHNAQVEQTFHEEAKTSSVSSYFTHLTHSIMKSFKQFAAVALAVVLVVTVGGSFTGNTYADHLDDAKEKLERIDELLEGKTPSGLGLIPVAMADEELPAEEVDAEEAEASAETTTADSPEEENVEESIDEDIAEEIAELVEGVIEDTEAAMEDG